MIILELIVIGFVGRVLLGFLVWVTVGNSDKPVTLTLVASSEAELAAARDAYIQGIKHSIYWETEGLDKALFEATGEIPKKETLVTKPKLKLIKTAEARVAY